MKKIAVIYYSRTGNTEMMADLICDGISKVSDIEAKKIDVEKADVNELVKYDGIIIGSPTYYGSMSWQIKKLIDDSVAFHGKLSGKVGAAFSSAANIGGGNETTITGILNAMLIHGMIVPGFHKGDHYGIVSIGRPDNRVENQCRDLGTRVAELAKRL